MSPILRAALPAFVSGGAFAWTGLFSASTFFDDLRAVAATQFSVFLTAAAILLNRDHRPSDRAHGCRLCYAVGLPRGRAREFADRFMIDVVEGYGMTETGAITYRTDSRDEIGSAGRPFGDWQLRIVEPRTRNEVPPNHQGEIQVRTDNPNCITRGYLTLKNSEHATPELGKWWLTGDIGRIDRHGSLWVVGRTGDVVRQRGLNINLNELEAQAKKCPCVVDAAAYARPGDLGESDVILAIVWNSLHSDIDELVTFLSSNMPRQYMPTHVLNLSEIPRTVTGRVRRQQLAALGEAELKRSKK